MKYKKIDEVIILEVGECREFEDVMNDIEETVLKHVKVIHGRREDSLIHDKKVKITIQIGE